MKYSIHSRRALKCIAFAIICLLMANAAWAQKAPPAKYQSKEFEDALRLYIINHPEVVLESIRLFQERIQLAKQEASKDAVAAHEADLFLDPLNTPVKAPSGAVTVVEFFDYRCGYCRKMQSTVEKIAGGPAVRLIYKELPILGTDSVIAAKAALASAKQGAYIKFHQALMNSPTPVTPETVDKLAAEMGLDGARLKTDMESPDIAASISRNEALAEALGISSTPTFVIGKEIAPGALTEEALRSLIESARNKAKSAGAAVIGGSL